MRACTCSDVADVPHAHAVLLSSEGVDEGQVGAAGGAEHHPLTEQRQRVPSEPVQLVSVAYSVLSIVLGFVFNHKIYLFVFIIILKYF